MSVKVSITRVIRLEGESYFKSAGQVFTEVVKFKLTLQ